jgi:FixJ family two-component response regulator
VTLLLREGRQLVTHLAARPVRQRTLLLVDDELSVLAALKRLFRREDYTILTASSGEQALDLLATAKVDVIISDQRMPGMTGVEFLRRVKALHPDTVRMTLSGFADLQSIIDAVNEGAVYKFLMKPWDDERLREHVAQAFAQKELADDNRRLQREVAQANAGLAALNERLGDLLGRQRVQASLIEAGAASARAMLDVLPAAVFGIAPDGVLAFMNRSADALVPSATMSLGGATDPTLARLIAELRADPACAEGTGHPVAINQQQHLAWLRHLGKESLDGADRGEILVLTPVQAPHV